jgi:hypothetical protein
LKLWRIFLEYLNASRQLHPGMPAAVIDRNSGRRKIRVRECSHGDAHSVRIAIFRMKQRGPAHRTEPEDEPRALITDASVLGRLTLNLVWSGESGERGKDAACSALARKAVADANTQRLTCHFDS